MEYTDLEKREIKELTEKIKERNEIHIKHSRPITNDMIHLLHHDDSLRSVYNKKRILVGTIQKVINKYEISTEDELYIDKCLYKKEKEMVEKVNEKAPRCREHCAYRCIIL